MTKQELLVSRINLLSEEEISSLLGTVTHMVNKKSSCLVPDCPHCGARSVIKYGNKCKKQRFLCKVCGRTFVSTTNTVMANSHFPAAVWKEVMIDTLYGQSIDYSAKRLGAYHQAVFNMRHKILLALQELPEVRDVCLGEVSELDETYVLDSYKGKKLDPTVGREARRHGAKARKRGISSEYLCICTGVQRKGDVLAATANRAKPSAGELLGIFEGHVADGAFLLCDGLRSYHALPGIAECVVRDCSRHADEASAFYHLNTVNGFHSFIKRRYDFYRGVASKYLNRYNALFSASYRNVEVMVEKLMDSMLVVATTSHYHSNRDVRETGLLAI